MHSDGDMRRNFVKPNKKFNVRIYFQIEHNF
jgi:hypothetical protein